MKFQPLTSFITPLLIAGLSACGQMDQDKALQQRNDDVVSANEAATPKPDVNIQQARAMLNPTQGSTANGVVVFSKKGDQPMRIIVDLSGLPAGFHGFHIHQHGDCSSPDASSAGGHFNPSDSRHGSPSDDEHHLGDLGNLLTQTNGRISTTLRNEDLHFHGAHSVIGRAVVIHAKADDFVSQPNGNAGARLACGVIKVTSQ